ncbi:MAG: hypothetical protein R2856_32900 [Caldilineaceae bacterium]
MENGADLLTNNSPDPWTYLIFRLYPGLGNTVDCSVSRARWSTGARQFSYREGILPGALTCLWRCCRGNR